MHKHPIIIIEDDDDDYDFLINVFLELNVEEPVIRFANCKLALEYLQATPDTVFIIICDINLPGMSGITMRQIIDEDPYLRKKCIPFVFHSTSASREEVNEAYDMIIQGFFIKPDDYGRIKHNIDIMLQYWRACVHPNNVN